MRRTALTAALLSVCAGVAFVSPVLAQDKDVKDKAPAAAAEKTMLNIGDKAPEFTVSKFVKGEAVTGFEKGRTYVVEFWATWCGPCKVSIPHLTEMQKSFGDKVTFIGVSVWENDVSKVEPFVEKMGDQMAYRVAMDDLKGSERGKMATNWLAAAGENGIPSAFVINGDGKIAWIGHPMNGLDKAIKESMEGKIDLVAAAKKRSATMEAEVKQQKAGSKISKLLKDKKWDEAYAAMDEMAKDDEDMKTSIGMRKFNIMLMQQKNYDGAYKLAAELAAGGAKNDAMMLNQLAWTIVDGKGIEKRDLTLAKKIAVQACEVSKNEDGMILDTLARVYFEQGDLAKAVEIQEKAVAKAKGEAADDIKDTLEKYKKALAEKK